MTANVNYYGWIVFRAVLWISLHIEKSAALKNNVMTHEKDICILKKGKWNNQSGHYSNRQKKSNLQGALLEGCLRRPY